MNVPLNPLSRRHVGILFAIVFVWAALLRFYAIDSAGFRFCDEGFHLFYPQLMMMDQEFGPLLYFKHGLMMWIAMGTAIVGTEPVHALVWSGLCGLATIPLFFLLVQRIYGNACALLSTLIFGSCRYVWFYQRSNMSDGHALFFFVLAVLVFMHVVDAFSLGDTATSSSGHRWRYAWLVVFGLLLGFSFTVRIQTCLTLLGMMGAYGLALVVVTSGGRWRVVWRYSVLCAGGIVVAYVGWCLVMRGLGDTVDWPRTTEWYSKNFSIAGGANHGGRGWRFYLFEHLWAYASGLFVIGAIVGLVIEGLSVAKRRQCYRWWFLIAALGLGAMYVKAALPWPRAHLYAIVFMAVFWSRAVLAVAECRSFAMVPRAVAVAIVGVTIAHETVLIARVMRLSHGYHKASEFMLSRQAGGGQGDLIVGTHSWPIFSCEYGNRGAKIIYRLIPEPVSYQTVSEYLFTAASRLGTRFMVLDIYASFTIAESPLLRSLQQFVLTVPPDAIFSNDLAAEPQAVADAFEGKAPRRDVFSHHIIVYDLYRLNRLGRFPREPVPFTNDTDMQAKLVRRLGPGS